MTLGCWTGISGYFDASGSAEDPSTGILTLAGYVATVEQWAKFERAWESVLSEEGVPDFHMAHFAHSKGAFSEGWKNNEKRRRSFLEKLVTVIEASIEKGFTTSMRLTDFAVVNSEYQLQEQISGPYGLCASMIAAKVRGWIGEKHGDEPTAYFFEYGDAHQQDVKRVMARDTVGFGQPPEFPRKRWQERPDGTTYYLRPFEAADFAAYEIRKAVPLIGKGKDVRGSLRQLLHRVPHENGTLGKDELRHICAVSAVPRR